ncbi:hypothetical protein [Photobacterium damselae]|uniref:HEPN domain-containing protein n=1 Tax=Photobacterium damselae subsp. damselae TaxID=85581 RepID=A0AAD3X0V6_PHODD|nr:hypothetical protein [Photobacterium damselae]KAB1185661.1 hypothetical protein F6450_01115 [Photobacterium damselae subsp. damselae]
MAKNEVIINSGLHKIASAQAIALANQAKNIHLNIGDDPQVHDVLAFLVTAGLSIELYFKALMIVGRSGRVTKGHQLKKLYDEFPDFLKESLLKEYQTQQADIELPIQVFALIQRSEQPSSPDSQKTFSNFNTFDTAIESINNIFTRSRYFFEEVNQSDYSYIEYPVGQIKAVIFALDATYNAFLANAFMNKEPQ